MTKLNVCPSTLQKGYNTYSPAARKALFDGREVSHIFAGPSPDADSPEALDAIRNVGRISLSGAQPKFSVVMDELDTLRYAREREQGLFILKPRPTGYHIINREYCAANEHVTMQIASQVYGIETAANGLCFSTTENRHILHAGSMSITGENTSRRISRPCWDIPKTTQEPTTNTTRPVTKSAPGSFTATSKQPWSISSVFPTHPVQFRYVER